jgi:8-oxo-dGTP pyrophosphatase MutT (NUDIX family)
MTEFTVDLHNYPEGGSVFRRTAVRGIIERQGKYLLVREKYGDYKFPGGGAEPGETLEETLAREIQEETGYPMKPGSAVKWGIVTERRKGQKADIMVMESHYFFCQVEGPAAKQKLDEYEEEHGFCPVWAALPEALEQNRRAEKEQAELCARGESPIPWVTRDRMVIERLLKDGGQP